MKKITYICLLLCLIGCNKTVTTTTSSSQITFCADSAYQFVQQQVAFGPRVPGTRAHTDCALFLLEKLSDFGAPVVLQQGNMFNYAGESQDARSCADFHCTTQLAGTGAAVDQPWYRQRR